MPVFFPLASNEFVFSLSRSLSLYNCKVTGKLSQEIPPALQAVDVDNCSPVPKHRRGPSQTAGVPEGLAGQTESGWPWAFHEWTDFSLKPPPKATWS